MKTAIPVLAGMGNALMAQPMVRQLASGAGAPVTIFARNASIASVFDRLDEVAEVRVFGNEPRQFARLLRELRAFRADLLVVPYPSNRWQYSLLASASRAKRVVIHDYRVGKIAALHGLVRHRVPTRDGRHDVLSNLDLLEALDLPVDRSMSPVFPLDETEVQNARHRLERRVAAPRVDRFCAIHAGSGNTVFSQSKRWSPEHFGQLVPRLCDLGYTPVLLEGPEDAGVGELLAKHTDAPVLQLTGTLADAAAVLAACDLYVGSDSGLAHLAAAVGTPPVTLFAPARPDEVSPWGYRHLVVQTPAACAPCFRYPQHATTPHVRCRPPYCIDRITVDAVMDKVAQASNTDASAADSGTSSA
ncbi:MAG: glycosyltransferase family 9 protein [Planctomycetota bacterium]